MASNAQGDAVTVTDGSWQSMNTSLANAFLPSPTLSTTFAEQQNVIETQSDPHHTFDASSTTSSLGSSTGRNTNSTLGKWNYRAAVAGDHSAALQSNPTLPAASDKELEACQSEAYLRGLAVVASLGVTIPLVLTQLRAAVLIPRISNNFIINSTVIGSLAAGNATTHFTYSSKLQNVLWERRLGKQYEIEVDRLTYYENMRSQPTTTLTGVSSSGTSPQDQPKRVKKRIKKRKKVKKEDESSIDSNQPVTEFVQKTI